MRAAEVTMQAGGEGSEEMTEVVRWLRQEKDTKAQELHLSQQENARLRQDCTRYQRETAAAAAEVGASGAPGVLEHATYESLIWGALAVRTALSHSVSRCSCKCARHVSAALLRTLGKLTGVSRARRSLLCMQAAAAGDRARQEAVGQQAHDALQAHATQQQLLTDSNNMLR